MSFPDLRTFIAQLQRANDIVYIDAPVNPVEEAAEIHRRVIAANGPAVAAEMHLSKTQPAVRRALLGTD